MSCSPVPPSLRGRIYALASYEALHRQYHDGRKAHTPSAARCLILLRYKAVCVCFDELCEILEIESLTFSMSAAQYRYIKLRTSNTYWSLVINCDKQTKTVNDDTIEYYPTSLFFIKDQSLITSFVPKAQEFNFETFLEEE